jgi:membrane protein involved in colicin uptake
MNARQNYIYTRIKRAVIGTATTGALLLFVGAAVPQYARAQDQDEHHEMRERDRRGMQKCQERTQKAEAKLTEEMREHGNRSRQADRAWMALREQRQRCFTAYHQWWNGRDQQWREDNDWGRDPRGDRDDHDRDRHSGGPGANRQ